MGEQPGKRNICVGILAHVGAGRGEPRREIEILGSNKLGILGSGRKNTFLPSSPQAPSSFIVSRGCQITRRNSF